MGLQERSGACKRSVGLIELRRGRLKDVGHSRRNAELDGDVRRRRRGGEARLPERTNQPSGDAASASLDVGGA